jgi:hypothetical protein
VNKFGPAIVSVIVLALYAANVLGYGHIEGEAERELMKVLTTMVVGYWIGSSSGSARKTEMQGEKQ